MASYTQDNRPLRVATPLAKDALLLERLSGEEQVSSPFHFTLEMLSENPSIDPKTLIRKPVGVAISLPGGGERYIHGRVNRFMQLGRRSGLTAYRAEVVPWLWFLSLSNDCRIFQNQSVTEIAELLFKEAGFTDFKIKVLKPLAQREYCVQYRESTLAFISRLLEEEGVFYFFEHEASKHTLIITDHGGQVPPCPVVGKLRMSTSDSYAMVEDPVVLSLSVEHAAITGSVSLNSFDYEHPTRVLFASVAGEHPNEIYDYFGGYTEKADGDRYARLRLEQKESEHQRVQGESNCASLTSGHKFDLIEHPNNKANQAYHLLVVRHAGSIPNYVNSGGEFEYSCSFEALPASVPYRPALVTPRPTVRGTQTAIVTGPSGEEIYTDKYGRVKLHFHWDRRGKFDENSSCWVRVSFAWAGKGYGNFSVPRIGQEVIVDFLEGDPDQPIVVGRVYNGDQAPPCDPAGKGGVISGLRSKTHKGSGFNEMTMDDTAGKEKIAIHAQYDMSTTVGHDDTQSVKNDRTISVTGKHTETIKADTSVTVSDGNYSFTVAKGTGTFKVEKKVTETFNDAQETTVKNDISVKSTAGKISIDAANEIKLHTGSSMITMKKDGSISIHGKKIEIIGDDEVKVSAPKVAVSGGQEAKFGVGNQQITCDVSKVNTSGAAINSSAVGMHEIAGALVKIN